MDSLNLIVITGTTRGIGRALVNEMIDRDFTVAGCGRSAGPVGELREAFPESHSFEQVDITDWTQVKSWAGSVLAELGAPSLLINNAGVINSNAPLWEVPDEEFRTVIETNITGTANVIRAFLPAMIDAGTGIVVNMSSGWGRSTAPEVAPYCASKWAIEGLTQALAEELPAGLAAVAVNPGVIDTDMLRSCWGDAAGSCPSPEAWAERAAEFLLALGPDDNGRSLSVG